MGIRSRIRGRLGRTPSSAKAALRLISGTTTTDELSRAITEGLARGLRNERARAAIIHIANTLSQRIAPTSDHAHATEALRAVLDDEAVLREFGSARLANITRLARAVGLFSASGPAARTALTLLARDIRLRGGRRRYEILAAVAIQQGDLDQAVDVALRARRSRYRNLPATRAVLDYVDLWAGGSPRESQGGADSAEVRFRGLVSGNDVVLYGPAPALGPLSSTVSPRRVARILMPRVTRWDSPDDLADGRVDMVYANADTTGWLATLPVTRRRELLDRYPSVSLKHSGAGLLLAPQLGGHCRLATITPGFVYGAPNMVPIMLFDGLLRSPSSLFITGATFFVGERAYRDGSRRFNRTHGATVDHRGSTGRTFERCVMFCRHDPVENHRFVANLSGAGAIDGDALFTASVNLSDSDYLDELDRIYGIDRV